MAKAKTPKPPKVEILLEISLCGERMKEMDCIDNFESIHEITKKYPQSNKTVITVPEITNIFGGPITFFVIYQKLPASRMKNGVWRVTDRDICRAIKELVGTDEDEEYDESDEGIILARKLLKELQNDAT